MDGLGGPVTLRPFVVVVQYPIRCGPLALPGMQQLLGNSLQLLTVGGGIDGAIHSLQVELLSDRKFSR